LSKRVVGDEKLFAALSTENKALLQELASRRGLSVGDALNEAAGMWIDAERQVAFFEGVGDRVDTATFEALLADVTRGEVPRVGDEIPSSYRRHRN
jgi:hypothetical protein